MLSWGDLIVHAGNLIPVQFHYAANSGDQPLPALSPFRQ
jgi:hypothetical protein